MKTLRYLYRLTTAFIIRFKGLLILGVLVGMIIYLIVFLISPYINFGNNRVIGLSGRYYPEELPSEVIEKLSDGLTSVNSSGMPEPSIASSWETPDQGNTWIFNLGEAYWHDGTRVTSMDINYNFTDVDSDKPDNRTIVFKLDDPYSPFPLVVSRPLFKQGLLGTGEWSVENLTVSQGYVQEVLLNDNNKNQIKYKFYPNETQAKTAFKLGEVDELVGLYNSNPFNNWETVNVSEDTNTEQVVTVFFNTQSDKFKENKPLRQALNYAINKAELSSNRAISPISPNSWAYNPQVKDYKYDLERAEELISDVPQEEKDKPINLSVSPILLSAAEQIKSDWEELGLRVNINVTSNPSDDYAAFLTIFEVPQDPDQYQIWHSTQDSNNISKYASDRIDGLLEEGRSELNLEERRRVYIDFQRFLLEEAPAAFLYHPTYYDITRK